VDELERFGHDASPPIAEHDGSLAGRRSRDCHGSPAGFTLIETLVALTVLFVVLVVLSTGLLLARRTSEALRAQRQVDRALEASLETLRAGELALRSGPIAPPPAAVVDFPVALQLEVAPRGSRGLYEVTLRAGYLRRGVLVERRLASQIWRPQ
jgi:type II secretory pathway pseudopilin PulG